MGALSPVHVILILAVALLVIGPGKLPETGAAIGRAMRDFRRAMDGTDEAAPVPTASPVAPSEAVADQAASDGTSATDAGSTGSV